MKIALPPPNYQKDYEVRRNNEIERAFTGLFGPSRDCEVSGGRIILTSPNGTRYALVVSNAGVLSTVAV